MQPIFFLRSKMAGEFFYSLFRIDYLLDRFEAIGGFAYIIPFLLVFAVVYGMLDSSKIFSKKSSGGEKKANNFVNIVIALTIALLSLQFDIVPVFFSILFPTFAIGLGVIIALLVLFTFLYKSRMEQNKKRAFWVAMIIGFIIILVAFYNFNNYNYGGYGFGWFQENFWAIIIGGVIILIIYFLGKKFLRGE